MTQKEELETILTLLRKYHLPISPILEFSIKEKLGELGNDEKSYSELSGEDIISVILSKIEDLFFDRKNSFSCVINYTPENGLTISPSGNNQRRQPSRKFLSPTPKIPTLNVLDQSVVCVKNVDWSTFEYGFAVERSYHDAIFQAVGRRIERGTSVPVSIIYGDEVYSVNIGNADVAKTNFDTIRVMYRGKYNHLGITLKQQFPALYSYIKNFKESNPGQRRCAIPPELQRFLVLKQTSEKYIFRLTVQKNDSV